MKEDILHTAIENLRRLTGINCYWYQEGPLDGVLELEVNGKMNAFVVLVKQEIRAHQIPRLELHNKEHPNLLLVARVIFPRIKEDLRQRGIPYLEGNGNIFLQKGFLFLFTDAQKPIVNQQAKSNRAFTKTGLKVLFFLLQEKDHLNLTHRALAKKTGVGLGNIPQILDGLKKTGFILPLKNKTWAWENQRALLDRWVNDYGNVLRPFLKKERYAFQGNWKDIALNPELTVWGGEPAADLLTHHLRPEKFILYTREPRVSLVRNYGLVPDQEGETEVLEMFWQQGQDNPIAPPVLVYADLLLEGGKRNTETAEIIYNEHIRQKL